MEFSSEGFDLDALAASCDTNDNGGKDDVVYEIGGGVSRVEIKDDKTNDEQEKDSQEKDAAKDQQQQSEEEEIMKQAQELKQQGNQAFLAKNWLEAYDMYTEAIRATPGPLTGREMIQQRNKWRAEEQARARRALAKQEQERQEREKKEREERRKNRQGNDDDTTKDDGESSSPLTQSAAESTKTTTPSNSDDDDNNSDKAPTVFDPPAHPYGKKYLSIYHCNRSAALLPLQRYDEAIDDCDIALLWNPTYIKALVRRAKAHEAQEHYDLAIADTKKALELEIQTTNNPKNRQLYQTSLRRLERMEAERMEKLKEETMSKLKDLGNSILGNFGLSLDNFNAVQDPNTGSYSISFDQNKNASNPNGSQSGSGST